MTTTNVDAVTMDELYEYISVLETRTSSLEATTERLNDENRAMRRSIAAYRANATIRRNRRETAVAA
jgi:hypothetical protein